MVFVIVYLLQFSQFLFCFIDHGGHYRHKFFGFFFQW